MNVSKNDLLRDLKLLPICHVIRLSPRFSRYDKAAESKLELNHWLEV